MLSSVVSGQHRDIGSRRELFVDLYLIDKLDGVYLKMHHPIKTTKPQSPLPVRHMMTVIKDGELFRAYWRGSNPDYKGKTYTGHPGETVYYAESADGHEWRFPDLGIVRMAGSTKNNAILTDQSPLLTNFMPFLDQREGIDPSERFKALSGHPGPGDKRGTSQPGRGLFAMVSPDGLHWVKKHEAIPYRPEWRHAFDSPNVSFWSESEQLYVCYFRTWTSPDRLRSISRATSTDFKTWSKPVAMNPNRPGEHLYTNMTGPYFRAPHLYIAMPTRFVPGRGGRPADDEKDANATDILLMSTRAGTETYDRTFLEAFIRPGLGAQAWKNRANYVANHVIPTGPTEMSIYHRSGDRYVLRIDGFVSASAGDDQGELLTKPLTFTGSELSFNASTSAAGKLLVELQTDDGRPIQGFGLADCIPIYGDKIDLVAHWQDNPSLESLSGKRIRMRLVMQECDVFSFQFR